MSWNYRVMRESVTLIGGKIEWYSIHEVVL